MTSGLAGPRPGTVPQWKLGPLPSASPPPTAGRPGCSGSPGTTRSSPWVLPVYWPRSDDGGAATEFSNITAVELTGPYRFHRTAGPARYSLADRGLTFATNGDRGVCITFREPIAGLEPTGRLLHPNLTLTVADCEGLAHALALGMVAPGVDAS